MSAVKGRALAPDVIKLAACAGVIVIHTSGYGLSLFETGSFAWLSCTFWDCLARFAVPVFFMCTGALMLAPERRLTGRDIFRRYFLRVLVILLVWAWLYYVYNVAGTYLFTGWLEPNWFLNSIVHTLRFDHHLHLYYLQILLLLYAALPVLRALVRGATERELDWAVFLWAVLGICWPLFRLWPPLAWLGGITAQYPLNMCWSAMGYALLGYVMSSRPARRERLGRYIAALALGFAVFGRSFGVRTAYTSLVLSCATWGLEYIVPMDAPMTSQPLLELIFAVGLPAVGSAILFNMQASSGGTDIVAMILKRHTSVNIGNCLLCVDFLITVAACVAFGMETGLFSMLVLKSVIVDMVLENIKVHKCFQIITEKPSEIVHFIVTVLGRGATELHGEGAYTHEDKTVILTVVNRYQAIKLRKYTREVDPHSFVLITNSTEIIGKGFRGVM